LILKFTWKGRKLRIRNMTLKEEAGEEEKEEEREEEEEGENKLQDLLKLQLSHQCGTAQKRQVNQWNKIESP
jgi:hypothetical protein